MKIQQILKYQEDLTQLPQLHTVSVTFNLCWFQALDTLEYSPLLTLKTAYIYYQIYQSFHNGLDIEPASIFYF